MDATNDLRAEHRGVLRMLDILESFAARLYADGTLPPADLADAIEFLKVFVDKCHHTKEELLLFPALRRTDVSAVEHIVESLEADHARGRAAVGDIEAASADGPAPSREVAVILAVMIERYCALLRTHIETEEETCFRLADENLPLPEQSELAAGYERIEVEVVGAGRHDAFHALLERLEAEYLAPPAT